MLKFASSLAAIALVALAVSTASAGTIPVTNGLVMYLDGNHVVTSGTSVTQMTDMSGNGNNAVDVTATYSSTGVTDPTLTGSKTATGVKTVTFSSAAKTMLQVAGSSSFNSTSGMTWYIVYKPSVVPMTAGRLIGSGYSDISGAGKVCSDAWNSTLGATYLRTFARTTTAAGVTVNCPTNSMASTSDFYLCGGMVDLGTDTATVLSVDNAGTVSTASATGATEVLNSNRWVRVGCGAASNSTDETPKYWIDGEIAAVVVYNRVLTSQELTDLDSYLMSTYVVPEPATMALLATMGLGILARRRHQ